MESPAPVSEVLKDEHPISFTIDNIDLIERDLKIETRRLVRPQPPAQFPRVQLRDGVATWSEKAPGDFPMWSRYVKCQYGKPGDVLWVRQTWQLVREIGPGEFETWEGPAPKSQPDGWLLLYRSPKSCLGSPYPADIKWRPNIFMPRWASRLLLRVEAVRCERLFAMTDNCARAEGVWNIEQYIDIWQAINAKRAPWESNPWVWVVRFSRIAS